MDTNDLLNRIKKRFQTLNKWATRHQISCYRLYSRDLPDFPFILDWYDGDCVLWLYQRKKDESEEDKERYISAVTSTVLEALSLNETQLHLKFRTKQKGLHTQYSKLNTQKITKIVTESNLKFELNLSDYLDVGLFLDHRKTRQLSQHYAKNKRVLNLFAYTGSFTCYAISAGALSTTSVDLSNTYSKWIQRNLKINGFEQMKSHRIITANCFSFLHKESSQNRYDLIICDPPTFSNSKNMKKSFSINTDYPELISLCLKCLAKKGILLFSTNSRSFKFDTSLFKSTLLCENISHKTIPIDFKRTNIHHCWKLTKL